MFSDPTFWTAVAFLILILAIGKTAWKKLTESLDERAAKIKTELNEAQELREQAQHLLADYQRQQRNAVKEAEAIVEHAQEEVRRLSEKAAEDLEQSLARREQQAKDRIAHAEAHATAEVRAAAVDLAVATAGRLMSENLDKKKSSDLVDAAIKDLDKKLH